MTGHNKMATKTHQQTPIFFNKSVSRYVSFSVYSIVTTGVDLAPKRSFDFMYEMKIKRNISHFKFISALVTVALSVMPVDDQ